MSFLSVLQGIPGIVSAWPMDDVGGTARDIIGPNPGTFAATAKPGPAFGDGQPSRVSSPSATVHLVTVPDSPSIRTADNFTVWTWFRRRDRDQYGLITRDSVFNIHIEGDDAADVVKFQKWFTGSHISSVGLPTADWYFVAFTKAGATEKFYIGSAAEPATVDRSGAASAQTLVAGTTPLLIGAFSTGSPFKGAMRNAGLASRALTKAEVDAIFTSCQPYPDPKPVEWGLHQDLGYFDFTPANVAAVARRQELARISRAKVVRHTLLWSEIEKGAAQPGSKDWARYDNIVDEATAGGQKVLFVTAGSPQWANASATDKFVVPGVGTDATFIAWRDKYVTFIQAAVARYKDRVKHWELWNEPNFTTSWNNAGAVSPTQYASFANAMRTAILGVDPSAKVAAGALGSPNAVGAPAQTGDTFWRNAVTAGLSTSFTYLSVHNYSDARSPATHTDAQNNFDDIQRVLDTFADTGFGAAKVWVTEFGWQTIGGVSVPEATQADYLDLALRQFRDKFSGQGVELVLVFMDRDWGSFAHGLYREADDTPKPSAEVFRAWASQFQPEVGPTLTTKETISAEAAYLTSPNIIHPQAERGAAGEPYVAGWQQQAKDLLRSRLNKVASNRIRRGR